MARHKTHVHNDVGLGWESSIASMPGFQPVVHLQPKFHARLQFREGISFHWSAAHPLVWHKTDLMGRPADTHGWGACEKLLMQDLCKKIYLQSLEKFFFFLDYNCQNSPVNMASGCAG